MCNKLVSIIMSTYNTDKEYLELSIESILNQTYTNLEFIIVNDGSEEDLKIISQYKDKRIKIINHKEKKGLPKSLNEAIEISNGEYIARMDSDDIALKNRLKEQVKYLEKNKDIDICSTFYKMFGKENRYVINSYIKPEEIKCELLFRTPLIHPGVMIRREFLERNNLKYDEEYIYTQDFELWTRCSDVGNIAIIPKLELNYRIHDNQIGISKKVKQTELANKVLMKNLKKLKLEEKDLKYLQVLNRNGKN